MRPRKALKTEYAMERQGEVLGRKSMKSFMEDREGSTTQMGSVLA